MCNLYVNSYILILCSLLSVRYNFILYLLTSGHNATDDLMTEVKATDCTPLPPLENLISYPYNIDVQRRKMEHELAPVWSKFVNLALCIINPIRSEDGGIIQNRINQVAINYLTRKDDHWSNYTSNSTHKNT